MCSVVNISEWKSLCEREKQSGMEQFVVKKSSQSEFEEKIVSCMLESNLAFNVVKSDSFRAMIQFAISHRTVCLPSREKMKITVKEMVNRVYEAVKSLSSRVKFGC